MTGRPYVYLSDTYLTQRWTRLVGSYKHETKEFDSLGGSDGLSNFDDRFNDIWNSCRR